MTLKRKSLLECCLLLCLCCSVLFADEEHDNEPGHCIWYGQIRDELTYHTVNKWYNGTAKPLPDQEAIDIFKKLCPHMVPKNDTPHTCCAKDQLQTFAKNMELPRQNLLRCPACFNNFVNLYCQFTCQPHHSRFLVADEVQPSGAISKVTYTVSRTYAEGLFNSCIDVISPSSNQRALSLLCGVDASECTPDKWFSYLGNNPYVPFPINMSIQDKPFVHNTTIPSSVKLFPMNETVQQCSESCSCTDCLASCSPIPPVPQPHHFTILGIDGMWFIMTAVYLSFAIMFMTCVILSRLGCCCKSTDSQNQMRRFDEGSINGKIMFRTSEEDLLKNANCCSRLGARMERKIEWVFERWGLFCTKHPYIVIAVTLVFCAVSIAGISQFSVITDPVELWSSPNSRARMEKQYFDDNFTPFYRVEQLIITAKHDKQFKRCDYTYTTSCKMYGAVFHKYILQEVLALQKSIEEIEARVEDSNHNITLGDICFAPLVGKNHTVQSGKCSVMSVIEYWQANETALDEMKLDDMGEPLADYLDKLQDCLSNPTALLDMKMNQPCLGRYGGPVLPWVAVGGYPENNYEEAKALVITYSVNNFKDSAFQAKASAWEAAFIKHIQNYQSDNITIAFSAQRSVQDELNRESRGDVVTISISYLLMFVYVGLALGQYKSINTIFVYSKVLLGLGGVVIVFVSVLCSLGIYSYFKVPATLIIIEVIPFLVLAVGVDNIFILVQAYQRCSRPEGFSVEAQLAEVVGKVGPSMLLTSLSESLAFFLGAMTPMPAVRIFSLYAALAVLVDFLLQITVFVSLFSLDIKREQSDRMELCCCVKAKKPLTSSGSGGGPLFKAVKRFYAPALLSKYVRPIVVLVFMGWFCACIAMVDKIDVGLDQSLSMPQGSYVLDYFKALAEFLSVGPPVYFVVQSGHDYTTWQGQNQICSSKDCPEESMLGQIYRASRQEN